MLQYTKQVDRYTCLTHQAVAGDRADKTLQGRSNRPLALQPSPMGVKLMRLPVQPQARRSAPGSLTPGSLTPTGMDSEPFPHHTRQERAATTVQSQSIVAVHASADAEAKPIVSSQTSQTPHTTPHTTSQTAPHTTQHNTRGIPESLSTRLEELNIPHSSLKDSTAHPGMPLADPSCVRRFKGGCLDPRVQFSLEPRAQNTQRDTKV